MLEGHVDARLGSLFNRSDFWYPGCERGRLHIGWIWYCTRKPVTDCLSYVP
jgi:hypothetical protein